MIGDIGFVQYQPFTTRPVRAQEANADYRHVDRTAFDLLIERDVLLFWDELFDHTYGIGKDAMEFIGMHAHPLVILPAWRVEDFLAMTKADAMVFHLINRSTSSAQSRLEDRSAIDTDRRIEDLRRQNEMEIENAIRIDESSSTDEIHRLIVRTIG